MSEHDGCSIPPVIPFASDSNVLAKLKACASAEEFFVGLGVPFDPAKLSVVRLHILKRMGEYIGEEELDGLPDRVVIARCRTYLERAYEDFMQSGPLDQRVFKVLKNAVAPAAGGFVALDELE